MILKIPYKIQKIQIQIQKYKNTKNKLHLISKESHEGTPRAILFKIRKLVIRKIQPVPEFIFVFHER